MSVVTRPGRGLRARVERPVQLAMPGFEIGPDDTVVDVGCGDGACCRYAGALGAEVIGIDVEPTLVERADEAMRGVPARSWRGIVGDCDPIPLPDACASVVICTEVMEHVDDPARFAAELARIGKPGARYLISVPDPASEALMRQVAPDWYWRRPFHVRVFAHADLDAVLASAGLKVERRELFGPYFSFRWVLWMTLGLDPYDSGDADPLMRLWEKIWGALMASPRSHTILRGLEQAVPKSQIVLASKPGGPRFARLRRGPPQPGRLEATAPLGRLTRRRRRTDLGPPFRPPRPVKRTDPGPPRLRARVESGQVRVWPITEMTDGRWPMADRPDRDSGALDGDSRPLSRIGHQSSAISHRAAWST